MQTDTFPQFLVPGHEAACARLTELFRAHHGAAATPCTLWDAWLPHATLWTGAPARGAYRDIFLQRRIGDDGYVSMQQHRGMAHSEGWPFPAWQQSGGIGWHFSTADEVWAIQIFALKPLASVDGWRIEGATVERFDPVRGLVLRAVADTVTITTPAFAVDAQVAPFVRLEWAAQNLSPRSRPALAWRLQGETDFPDARGVPLPTPGPALAFAHAPLYKTPGYRGKLVRLRLTLDRANGAQIHLKSLITAIDSRHPITNANFVRGCAEYFAWTGDDAFQAASRDRMRRALRFALKEFDVERLGWVRVPWSGHDGRSGLSVAGGKKTIHPGIGVGNNYWDLLPFGGDDALATIYLYDALRKMAEMDSDRALSRLADRVRKAASRHFWNPAAGRFYGWRDLSGRGYDYGFTFVNLEAIHYGVATPAQARRIFDWLDGRRIVDGDTSQGADIYHWRFAPRATTRRNIETYVWAWSGPETIPWGGQVQDGGAVLGFSYFDTMARLKTLGPDNAWQRLKAIIDWYDEVQREGGYRAYYAKPGRGTLQGGGTAGGLGLDVEFLESVLVPQVLLYGFLGVHPRPDGLAILPKLPAAWPSLTVTGVHFHGHVLDIAATRTEIRITPRATDGAPLSLRLPGNRRRTVRPRVGRTERFAV